MSNAKLTSCVRNKHSAQSGGKKGTQPKTVFDGEIPLDFVIRHHIFSYCVLECEFNRCVSLCVKNHSGQTTTALK